MNLMQTHTAGFLPLSLSDYPGHVSSVIFFTGCNYHCPYCQNPLLAQGKLPDDFLPLAEIFDYLKHNRKNLEGVVITGGEPTLYTELANVIEQIHKLGLRVKLDSNGSNPHVIKALQISGQSPDFYAIDIKTSKDFYSHVTAIPDCYPKVLETLTLIRASGISYEVRITCAPGFITLEQLDRILNDLEPYDTLVLQQYRSFSTLDKVWTKHHPPYDDAYIEQLLHTAKGKIKNVLLR